MKHSKDPFEAALEEEQEESPPESPVGGGGGDGGDGNEDGRIEIDQTLEEDERDVDVHRQPKRFKTSVVNEAKNKDEEEEEEEENMEVELTKYPTSAGHVKIVKTQIILSQFTEDQMSRYESFRRSTLGINNMKKFLIVTGIPKPSDPILAVTCGIAKMFVGELVETGKRMQKSIPSICLCCNRESVKPLSPALISILSASSNCYVGKGRIRTYKTLPYQRVLSETKARRKSALKISSSAFPLVKEH